MKSTTRLAELRARTSKELQDELRAKRQELFNLRFQMATGKLDNHREVRNVRRDLARILGLMHEQRLRGQETAVSEPPAEPEPPPAAPPPRRRRKEKP